MTETARIPPTLAELKVPINGLTPYSENPRRGNIEVIVESLARHGQYRPIVVRAKTFEVLAGNHTLLAARELGWTEIAATFVEVSDDEAARIVLVDNRAADLGGYDDRVLAALLESLDDLTGTGFTDDDLETLLALHAGPIAGTSDEELQAALDEADRSAWPWVKVQLDPDTYRDFTALPGGDDEQRLLHLLTLARGA